MTAERSASIIEEWDSLWRRDWSEKWLSYARKDRNQCDLTGKCKTAVSKLTCKSSWTSNKDPITPALRPDSDARLKGGIVF